jgi:hypothetical protein
LGAAEALTETIDRSFWPYARDAHERTVAALLAALGEPAFVAARAEGRQLSLEQAIDLAVPGAGGPHAVGKGSKATASQSSASQGSCP